MVVREIEGVGGGETSQLTYFPPISWENLCEKREGGKTTDRNLSVINSKFARVKNSYNCDSSYVNLQLFCFEIILYFFIIFNSPRSHCTSRSRGHCLVRILMALQQRLDLVLDGFGRGQHNAGTATAPSVGVPGRGVMARRRHIRAGPRRNRILQQRRLETVQMVLVIHAVDVDDLHFSVSLVPSPDLTWQENCRGFVLGRQLCQLNVRPLISSLSRTQLCLLALNLISS